MQLVTCNSKYYIYILLLRDWCGSSLTMHLFFRECSPCLCVEDPQTEVWVTTPWYDRRRINPIRINRRMCFTIGASVLLASRYRHIQCFFLDIRSFLDVCYPNKSISRGSPSPTIGMIPDFPKQGSTSQVSGQILYMYCLHQTTWKCGDTSLTAIGREHP
jgi:hypothetical protein